MFLDFIFETSWEVCNKVGGIYTVLSTRAKTLQEIMRDRIVFIGPDCFNGEENPYFFEDKALFNDWLAVAKHDGLSLKIGRWNTPGTPIAFLVDFKASYADKNKFYGELWERYGVDSLHAYGDYDDSAMFSYATAKVVESFFRFYLCNCTNVIFHANEWQTGFAALALQHDVPEIATIFTTHATGIGRSIAGNNKPLYDYLQAYNGDQMADELNMQSKHSIEKQTAHYVDCFTTVSDITAVECKELLDKPVDAVLPNGFEDDFVPKAALFTKKRNAARKRLLRIAEALTGSKLDDNTLIVSTSGRYEFRNKGIDVFIEAINKLRHDEELQRDVVVFIEVPGWVARPRTDLQERLATNKTYDTALFLPLVTHELHNMDADRVLNMARHLGIANAPTDKVKLIFIPCYLNGDDGIVNMSYYDVVLGNDLCVYPSYYEPWGYTPLESIAFKVPCITTDLAGFGLWANQLKGKFCEITDGVKVIHRTDNNYFEVADSIKQTIKEYAAMDKKTVEKCRANAQKLSKKALWREFIQAYKTAYDIAIKNRDVRLRERE
ncbi:glycogen/starch synthase [Prevotella nigrescens]|uniref:glycogen/starch synthase n=1 Tax=Prevotella nigrescens TaxID=28133 RepID=UPI0002184354|nr:glycogen/starch synthase [Prevotella nigrescens]EGQ13073.1 glycosyltransferase family alpha-glycosyltransferase [Prevotella nigrescens ATCC 33563]UAK28693.1 glycogen/starch synthase [Prevotella nigrescens]WMS22198.1 glycogen/starch synthase [Prevotella nigrescens]SUB93397.1 glycogen synthase [Prevotella nigrescens]